MIHDLAASRGSGKAQLGYAIARLLGWLIIHHPVFGIPLTAVLVLGGAAAWWKWGS